jgi:hypothetical protein
MTRTRTVVLLGAFLLGACDGGGMAGDPPGVDTVECGTSAPAGNLLDAAAWRIGPLLRIDGDWTNKSSGVPRQPAPADGGGWSFEFPNPTWANGHVHYVTHHAQPLAGKTRIVMRYRIDAEPGTTFITDDGAGTPMVTLYFQQRGDDWRGMPGETESYRWWATFASQSLSPGEHEMVAPLDGPWTATLTSSRQNNPAGFAAAIANIECLGMTFGGGSGYGHGLAASAPARFVLLDFRVE